MRKYRKFIVAAAAAVIVVVGQLCGLDSDVYRSVVAVLGAVGVYAIPNA